MLLFSLGSLASVVNLQGAIQCFSKKGEGRKIWKGEVSNCSAN